MSVKILNSTNFQDEIDSSKGVALIDFYADWCGPCRMISPVVKEIAEEREDIMVGKVNVDTSAELAAAYNVMSIPTIIVFKDGKEYTRSVGYRGKKDILAMVD